MKELYFYPTLDGKMLHDIGCSVSYKFDFFDGIERQNLEYEDTKSKIGFTGKSVWNPIDYDLNMKVSVRIKNSSILYGINGVAPRHAKLGLCLEWIVPKSRRRGIIFPDEDIYWSNEEILVNFATTFKKKYFDNNIEIALKLYLKEASTLLEANEEFLNNDEGLSLGVLDNKEIFVKGQGSLFPYYVQNNPDDPNLWSVKINIEDPSIDKLSDCVKLVINSAHKDFELTDNTSKNYCDRVVTEIVASALTIVFESIREQMTDLNSDYQDGSILDYAKYCKNVLHFDFSSASTTSESIRRLLEGAEE